MGQVSEEILMIREAVPGDHADVRALCERDLGYACDGELVRARLENLDGGRERVFVAEKDGKVVGFVHVERYETVYAESMANIL